LQTKAKVCLYTWGVVAVAATHFEQVRTDVFEQGEPDANLASFSTELLKTLWKYRKLSAANAALQGLQHNACD